MKKRVIGVAIVVVVVAVGLWWNSRDAEARDGALYASGTVEATEADLAFQMPGRILTVAVQEGVSVSVGTELARLDAREVEASARAARAQLAAAQARRAEVDSGSRQQEILAAEAALRATAERASEAEREARRATTLHDGGAISRQAMERAATAADLARAEQEQADQRLQLLREGARSETRATQSALVEQARAQVELAEATVSNAIVTAPFAGLVTIRHREPGESVAPGVPVVTLLDPTDRWVRIYVQEDAMGRVHVGQTAEIRSDTYPDRAYEGEVVFIGSEAEFTPRNVQTTEERTKLVYPVKVRITRDPDFELKPGTPADVLLREPGA